MRVRCNRETQISQLHRKVLREQNFPFHNGVRKENICSLKTKNIIELVTTNQMNNEQNSFPSKHGKLEE